MRGPFKQLLMPLDQMCMCPFFFVALHSGLLLCETRVCEGNIFSIIQTVLWFAVKLSQVQYSSKGMGAAANREATCVCGAHGLYH